MTPRHDGQTFIVFTYQIGPSARTADRASVQCYAGQRAMAVAMIYPEPKPGQRTDLKGSASSEREGVSGTRVSMARTVIKWAPKLCYPRMRCSPRATLAPRYLLQRGAFLF